jgi:hypothetical protein
VRATIVGTEASLDGEGARRATLPMLLPDRVQTLEHPA